MSTHETNPYEFEVFYDGGCPLCVREIGMLRRWDRRKKIRFTDIDAKDFDAALVGKSYDELMIDRGSNGNSHCVAQVSHRYPAQGV